VSPTDHHQTRDARTFREQQVIATGEFDDMMAVVKVIGMTSVDALTVVLMRHANNE
jgi:hypothetical protein